MILKPIGCWAVVTVMAAAAVSCGTHRSTPAKAPSLTGMNAAVQTASGDDTLSDNARSRFDYFYLEAVRQQEAGNYDAAFDLLRHCLTVNPRAAEAYYQLAAYYSELEQDSVGLQYLEKAAALSPLNDTYQERVAQYYINTNAYDKAISAYEKLYTNKRERTDVLNILMQLYQQKKDYDGMLSAVNRLEQVEGGSEEMSLSKMRIYEMKNDKRSAYETLKKLSEQHPNDLNYKIMTGNWLLQNSRKKEAFRILSDAVKAEPDNTYAQNSLYDFYMAEGQNDMARQLRDRILLSQKTPSKTLVSLLQEVIKGSEKQSTDSSEVLNLFRRVETAHPADADVVTLRAAYMTLKQMPEDSINHALAQVLRIKPDASLARKQLVQSYWNKQDWKTVVDLSRQGVQYNPDDMSFYYFLGFAYYQQDKYDESLDAFQRGVSQINSQSNPDIVSDFYALMGEILHKKGQHDAAYAAYDSCLQWKDDNVVCLNNYAYFLSEDNKNLQKAEQMSFRTIKAEPKNNLYLDTYAWILFLENRHAEAKIYIDQALANDTDSVKSAVVLEHAGDIYALNGDVGRAVDYWQQAVDNGIDNKEAVLRKIKLKKYIKKDEK